MSGQQKIFQVLCRERNFQNIVISPFSINRALAVLQEGCGKESKAHTELSNFLDGEPFKEIEKYAQMIESDSKSPLKMAQVILWNPSRAGERTKNYVSQLGSQTKWLLVEGKGEGNGEKEVKKLNQEISILTKGG